VAGSCHGSNRFKRAGQNVRNGDTQEEKVANRAGAMPDEIIKKYKTI